MHQDFSIGKTFNVVVQPIDLSSGWVNIMVVGQKGSQLHVFILQINSKTRYTSLELSAKRGISSTDFRFSNWNISSRQSFKFLKSFFLIYHIFSEFYLQTLLLCGKPQPWLTYKKDTSQWPKRAILSLRIWIHQLSIIYKFDV